MLAVGIAFSPVIQAEFVSFDDRDYILENPPVLAGLTWQGIVWAWQSGHAANWHPLTWISHMLDVQLYGVSPTGHHVTSLLLHASNAALVFLLFRQLTGARWRSALVAALFALHPLRVESVAWVSERKDVLCAFFGLLTLLAYAKYAQAAESRKQKAEMELEGDESEKGRKGERVEGKTSNIQHPTSNIEKEAHLSPERRRRWIWYAIALFCFALGLMSKPMLVTWPFVMLLLDYWPLGRVTKMEGGGSSMESTSPRPSPQSGEGDGGKTRVPGFEFRVSSWKSLVIEKLPFFALMLGSCLITYLVQGNAGAMQSWEHYPLGDRLGNAVVAYARYLAKIFWPAELSAYYAYPGDWPPAAVAGAALTLAGVSAAVLWQLRQRPFQGVGWFWFLGVMVPVIGIVQVGGQSMADRYTYLPTIGVGLAFVWSVTEARARPAVNSSLVTMLGGGTLLLLACLAHRQTAYWLNSEALFRRVLAVEPDSYMAHFGLANALLENGREEEGMRHLQRTRELNNNFPNLHGKLGYLAASRGDYREAVAAYQRMLELQPDAPEALNNLAWLRATCPDAAYRDGPEAVRLAERACELTRYEKTIYIGTLAAAYAEAGRFGDAIATAQRAHDQAVRWGEEGLAQRNLELMRDYRMSKAFHEVGPTRAGDFK